MNPEHLRKLVGWNSRGITKGTAKWISGEFILTARRDWVTDQEDEITVTIAEDRGTKLAAVLRVPLRNIELFRSLDRFDRRLMSVVEELAK